MKGTDRTILLVLPVLALAIGFWLLVLGPKRAEVSKLDEQIGTLQAEVDSSEAQIAQSEGARDAFPKNYADLISLGTAVPEDDDQATLIQGFTEVGRENSLNFRSFTLVPGTGGATVAAAPVPATTDPNATADPNAATTVAAPPTEATAATLPLGATIGPAGLPITPYALTYNGKFFDFASLFGDLTGSVEVSSGDAAVSLTAVPRVHGRLLTIDGFHLQEDQSAGFPNLSGELNVTTYLVPAEQGLAAGATPAGPAPVGSPQVPVTTTPATTTPPAATVTP